MNLDSLLEEIGIKKFICNQEHVGYLMSTLWISWEFTYLLLLLLFWVKVWFPAT